MELIEIGLACIREALNVLNTIDSHIIKFKGSTQNVQSSADIAANDAIIKKLKEAGPPLWVISEEGEPIKIGENPEVEVYVDPLDGSSFFLTGNKRFCSTSLMFVKDGKVLASFVGDIITGDIYYCDDQYAYFNGQKITFFKEKKGERYAVAAYATKGDRIRNYLPKLFDLAQNKIFVTINSGCLEQAQITVGQYDATAEFLPIGLWEFCGSAIAQRAGAILTTIDGKPFEFRNIKQAAITARNEEIHQLLLDALRQ